MTGETQYRGGPRTRRVLPRLVVMLPVSMVLLVAAAPGASAAIGGVGRGEVVRVDRKIPIVADYGPAAPDSPPRLTLTEPGGPPVVVASAPFVLLESGRLNYSFDTQCWVASAPNNPCVTPRPARNGIWTLAQTGGASDTVPFQLLIAPRAPTAVTAIATSPRDMRVSWRRGAEPDLTEYTVFEGETPVRDGLAPDDICDDAGACGTDVSYPSDGTGEHTYTVRAARSDGMDDFLVSPRSASASGTFLAPLASPQPTDPGASPAPGGGTDGLSPGASGSPSPGASSSPGAVASPGAGGSGNVSDQAAARRQAFSLGFDAFAPKLGIPKLPPLPKAPQAPAVANLPDGTFEPTLGFEDQVLREEAEPGGGAAARVTSAVGNAIDSERLARSAAGALVLLLIGAHLRRWLGAAPQE